MRGIYVIPFGDEEPAKVTRHQKGDLFAHLYHHAWHYDGMMMVEKDGEREWLPLPDAMIFVKRDKYQKVMQEFEAAAAAKAVSKPGRKRKQSG